MITWDGVLASMQRRADMAALRLPGFPLKCSAGKPAVFMQAAGAGTAAGDPTDRVTGSHNAATGEQS